MAAKLIAALENKNEKEIEEIHNDVIKEIRACKSLEGRELCNRVGETIFRSYCSEIYLPDKLKQKNNGEQYMALQ